MDINTALTEALGLEYPIVSALMGSISGGRLAAAVSNAGGLGLVGGGYGDHVWLRDELSVAKAETVRPWGVGLITWATTHETVQLALSYEPHTFMLSFGDPRPHVPAIKEAGCKLICQVQGLEGARAAKAAGADVIVAQGTEERGQVSPIHPPSKRMSSRKPPSLEHCGKGTDIAKMRKREALKCQEPGHERGS